MESLNLSKLFDSFGSNSTNNTARSHKSTSRSGRNTARSGKSTARSGRSTARSKKDAKKRKSNCSDSDSDFIQEDTSSEEEDEWIEAIEEEKSVTDAMKRLWKEDPETFYIYGSRIKEMLIYKFENNFSSDDGRA
jgi:hypothetical protein